jgi:hypothetical protein
MKLTHALCVLLLLVSQHSASQMSASASRMPLGSLLNPDGTVRLAGGAVVTIDPAGYRLAAGPHGEPRFLPANAPDSYWDPRCVIPGADGEVKALALDGGTLYVGGSFTKIGNIAASSIAAWDGSSWSPLGAGMNGSVEAISVSGTTVYAAGAFTSAGGVPAAHIAGWNGAAWSALGAGITFSGPSDAVLALAVDGTDLYVGGHFSTAGSASVSHIARWDGAAWSALGSGLNNSAKTILIAGGDLYVGGYFTSAGGGPTPYIAKWDGGAWSGLSFGLNGPALALAQIGTDIYAGGFFTTAGGGPALHAARWDGSAWSALGAGTDGAVSGLAAVGSSLYAAGAFASAGGTPVDGVARWSAGTWSAVGAGSELTGADRNAIVGSGSVLYLGGLLGLSSTGEECNLARWNGGSWSSLQGPGAYLGLNGTVRALFSVGGAFFVGGNFSLAGQQPSTLVAYWDGASWHRYPGLSPAGTVNAILVHGGSLYIGGANLQSPGASGGILKWSAGLTDSTGNWVTPSGAASDIAGTVNALIAPGYDIYVGGSFSTAGGTPANNIASWSGASWSALGAGITGGLSPSVLALAWYSGELYAGGSFLTAGSFAASRIAKWDGSAWWPVGGASGSVLALASDQSGLYAAGLFTIIGAAAADRIARWDGAAWHPLGAGFPAGNVPRALAADGIELYVGGQLTMAGGVPVRNIARWNGASWAPLGSGVDTTVYALASDDGGTWAGGNFTSAGGKSSFYLAGWGFQSGRAVLPARSLAFGETDLGATALDSIRIENLGNDTLRIDSVAAAPGAFAAYPEKTVLGANEVIVCHITFSPASVGAVTGSVILYHDGFSSPDTVAVSGTGRAPIRIVKLRDADGSPGTPADQTPMPWHLSLYRESVAPENLVMVRDSSELTAFVAVPGTYILCESDSAAPWRRVNGNLTSRDTVTLSTAAVADTFVNYKPNLIVVTKHVDGDGQFGTAFDRSAKGWHLEIRADSLGGPVVAAGESGTLASGELLDGTYVLAEADSASYLRLGVVVDGVPQAGESGSVALTMTAGRQATVDFVNAPAGVSSLYRSVSAESLALDKDAKGKTGKRIARKPDKVEFDFPLTVGASPLLTLSFSMDVSGVVTRGTAPVETLAVIAGKQPPAVSLPVAGGETVHVSGWGVKGKPVKAKYFWGASPSQTVAVYLLNQPRLPMPNRVNLLAETFEQGGFAATAGLLVGRVHLDSVKQYGWLQSPKYTDVLKSLNAKGALHAGTPAGFSTFLSGSLLLKPQKSLPPTKVSNRLLADMIALKVNIAASALGKTPPGFGELVYDDGSGNPLAGMTVREIASYGDSVMMGRYSGANHLFPPAGVFANLDTVIAKINRAFEGPIDTFGFSGKLAVKGTASVRDAGCLLVRPGSVPARIVAADAPADQLPSVAALYQNYPNPFNPSTVIRFDLEEPSLVSLAVYDILGREVARLLDHAPFDAGEAETEFDAGRLASGVYLYKLSVVGVPEEGAGAGARTLVGKMMVLR